MKGTKYLSDLVDLSLLKKKKLNIIKADVGSGKTYFALTHIPALTEDANHKVVYLIDTINGRDQILRNYKTESVSWDWAKEVDDGNKWFSEDDIKDADPPYLRVNR